MLDSSKAIVLALAFMGVGALAYAYTLAYPKRPFMTTEECLILQFDSLVRAEDQNKFVSDRGYRNEKIREYALACGVR